MRLFFFLLGLDQLTKWLAGKSGWVHFNSGMSFGMGSELHLAFWIILSLVAFIYILKSGKTLPIWFKWVFLAGMISNFIDRLIFAGRVRDWLPIPFTSVINNLADWYIFLAVSIYILQYLYEHRNFIRR